MTHETTIKRIQELTGGMALENGCRISVSAEAEGDCNESTGSAYYSSGIDEVGVIIEGRDEVVFRDGHNLDPIYLSSFEEGYDEDYEMTFKILGKPITLAVVLLALNKAHNEGDENYCVTPNGWICILGAVGRYYHGKAYWNLSKDNFNDQSEETKSFIGGLLTNNSQED